MTASAITVPFVTSLRSRPGIVRLGDDGAARVTVRVTLPEQWDTIAFNAAANVSVSDLKLAALREFGLPRALPADFVMKLLGWEVLGESSTIAESGARDGSTFLLTYRRRRAVR